MDSICLTDSQKESAKFLDRDFNQCFKQMRHYDGQIVNIVKFALTAYATITAASLGFYKYGLDKNTDYRAPALAIVIAGFMLGITLTALVNRYRAYFVMVTRYINEHRAFFLKDKPLGFTNETEMYTNTKKPSYFNWRSSHALLLYSLALLNSGLLGIGLYLFFDFFIFKWWIVWGGIVILFILQLWLSILYLRIHEKKIY